jgi:prevent-host-death family protein
MWAGLNHGSDGFGQASLRHDWQFAIDRCHILPASVNVIMLLTGLELSYKMLYMRKVANISIRDLQQNLKRVISRVERGQIVEVTRHRRPVARLAPMRPIGAVPPWPDLGARARAVFGDRLVMPGPSQVVIDNRGER